MKILRLLTVALVLFIVGSWIPDSASANRAVAGYTLVPVTAANCTAINIQRQSDGAGGTVIVTTFTFEVMDNGGVVRYSASVSHQLTSGERTSLATFISNVAVPLLNSAENL